MNANFEILGLLYSSITKLLDFELTKCPLRIHEVPFGEGD